MAMKRAIITLILVFLSFNVHAWTTNEIPHGPNLPAECKVGEPFYDTGTQTFYICDPANVWGSSSVQCDNCSSSFASLFHAARHNDGGADEVDRGTEGVIIGTLTVDSATPDVSNGGSYVYRLFTTANTTPTTITDFVDDTSGGDHSEFSDGDWFVMRCLNNTTINFNDNSNIEGNANVDFACSSSQAVDLLFRWDSTNTRWVCLNLTSGFSTPTTMNVTKIQTQYAIASPQAITIGSDVDAGSDEITIGTEVTSSTVYLVSDSDDDTDTLILNDPPTGFDGLLLTFFSKSGFDAPADAVVIDVETNSACNSSTCPFGGAFALRGIGASLSLRWDLTTSSWWLVDYYQPPVDYLSDGDYQSTVVGFDFSLDSSSFLEYSVRNSVVSVIFRIKSTEDGTDVSITVPFTSKVRSTTAWTKFPEYVFDDGNSHGTGYCYLDEESTTVVCKANDGSTWNDPDNNGTRSIEGQFSYQAE